MSQLLLAVDTSGKNGGLALARMAPEMGDIVVLEVVPLTGGAFSAQLVPQISGVLKEHGYRKDDLGAFAVVNGPGSFTGLRVGLAAVKALAEALQKPIVAISLLEAVAFGGPGAGRVLGVVDAGRGDVYSGEYEVESLVPLEARRIRERLLSLGEFLAESLQGDGLMKTVVTPDVVLADTIRGSGMRVELIEYPDSAAIARIGWEQLRRGRTVRPEDLEANYIRQSDAEIFSKPAG
ncbi:MAG: tRNA (adenosine(37)-N6)-threonylcarbamoyltransferase complex dimerization subunit type 1 TsaB [Terriglobales bacterium]